MYDIHRRMLHDKKLNRFGKKIFFIWANEDWSNNPAFGVTHKQILNTYDDYQEMAESLVEDFKSPHYLKRNNCPVFYIHHPWFMKYRQIKKYKETLLSICLKKGFSGLELRINLSNIKNIYNFQTYDFHPRKIIIL